MVSNHPINTARQAQKASHKHSLAKARTQLPVLLRPFSIFIHISLVDTISNILQKLFQPIVVIGGAIFSIVATLFLQNIALSHGHRFNYLAVVFAFVIGTIFGLIAQLTIARKLFSRD